MQSYMLHIFKSNRQNVVRKKPHYLITTSLVEGPNIRLASSAPSGGKRSQRRHEVRRHRWDPAMGRSVNHSNDCLVLINKEMKIKNRNRKKTLYLCNRKLCARCTWSIEAADGLLDEIIHCVEDSGKNYLTMSNQKQEMLCNDDYTLYLSWGPPSRHWGCSPQWHYQYSGKTSRQWKLEKHLSNWKEKAIQIHDKVLKHQNNRWTFMLGRPSTVFTTAGSSNNCPRQTLPLWDRPVK